ncbi:MAG: hydroxymethylbilane synthase, partial [Gemmatimonadota bacterium]
MNSASRRIRIGTRGSALARWQAEHVATALRALPSAPDPELILIKTEGDRIQDVPLWKVQGKAFFTKEIEEALLQGQVDVAVHSLKDLATEMPSALTLGAVLEREDPRDALLFSPSLRYEEQLQTPDDLPRGARVGTSSLRRRALLARWRPDLVLAELRGNVPTRIRKLDEGGYDAIVLAAAGVKRLGLAHRVSAYLPFDFFLPAVSQGAIGVQIRADDLDVAGWVGPLEHAPTRAATTAERALLRRLEGGCQVPVGAFAELDGAGLRLRGVVCSLDGKRWVEGEVTGPPDDAERLGIGLAEELIR